MKVSERPRARREPRTDNLPAILVVDDNQNKRTALGAVLEPLGYSIVEADCGVAALRRVAVQDFAVILLDVQMPGMDGFETAALIRLRKQSELTPIIFVTSHAFDELMTDRYAEGAVDFMFAPFKPDELRAKVSVFGHMYANAEALASRAREVEMSADQLRLLTESAPIGIFHTDVDNRYVYTNPRWTEMTGMSAADAAGQPFEVVLSAGRREDLLVEGGGVRPPDELAHRFEVGPPGAGSRTVRVTSERIHDEKGAPTGWVGTMADVTAEVLAVSAMADAVDKATTASRLKSDFLANMSHEIRTPMNGVLGMTDLLLETALDPRQRDYAQTVRNSGEALLAIINDILDFSKVEAGMLAIETVDFDVRAVVQDVVDLLAPASQVKGIELLSLVGPEVPAVVSGDPGRLRQVLTNLVGNALKFTQDGEVVVRVSGGDTSQRCDLRFEVTDTGDGVPEDKLGLIFQPFSQGDTSTARRYGGTGLGLAISSRLVALMNGQCGVASRHRVGSTFWFTVRVDVEPGQRPPDLLRPDPDLAGVSVLVVDGNATSRESLSRCLRDWGLRVCTADSSTSALAQLGRSHQEGTPTTVVLLDRSVDLDLPHPGPPGDDGAPPARLVLMTLLGEEDPPGEGVCASLSKPVHLQDLRRCLRVAARLPVVDPVPADGRRPDGPVGPVGARLLLVEDNVINQKVALEMLTSAGYRVDVASNGAAAVEATGAQAYDAVLMDCQMPEMNGFEATSAIRAQEGPGRRTPIIAMTAGARSEDRERCLAAGMDGYLSKPASKPLLIAKLAHFLKDGRTAHQADPVPDAILGGVVDPAVVAELRALGEEAGPDFFPQLVSQFVGDVETRLRDLRTALQAGDAGAVGGMAHSVKGSSATMGGRRLASACARLERRAQAGLLVLGAQELRELEEEFERLRQVLEVP